MSQDKLSKGLKIQEEFSWGNYKVYPDTDILMVKCDVCSGTGTFENFKKPTYLCPTVLADNEAMEYIRFRRHPCFKCFGSGVLKETIRQELKVLDNPS